MYCILCHELVTGHVFSFSRNLSYTKISSMPYSNNLEGWLRVLDLRGTRDLHIFDSHMKKGANRLKGQAFFVLNNVSFHYHAHCCQLKRSNYSYLEPDFSPRNKERERFHHCSTFSKGCMITFSVGKLHIPPSIQA